MRSSDVRSQTASVRLSRDKNAETSRWYELRSGFSLVLRRLESPPAFLFIVLSLAFGSAISVVVPPLRGPDEIAHFLRIYSYAQGELLPAVEVDGRVDPDRVPDRRRSGRIWPRGELQQQGGNVIGFVSMNTELGGKRLGLLRELLPKATRFGVLVNPNTPSADLTITEAQRAASAIGQYIDVFVARTNADIDTAFSALAD
jgi:hypothetical protein